VASAIVEAVCPAPPSDLWQRFAAVIQGEVSADLWQQYLSRGEAISETEDSLVVGLPGNCAMMLAPEIKGHLAQRLSAMQGRPMRLRFERLPDPPEETTPPPAALAPIPPTPALDVAQLIPLIDPALAREEGLVESLQDALTTTPLDASSPEALVGDIERIEDRFFDNLRSAAIEQAKERATLYHSDYHGAPRVVSRNERLLASEVARIDRAEAKRRHETAEWRARRRGALPGAQVVAAATVLLHTPARYLDHCKEYVEAAGDALKRKTPLLGSASTSAWETSGGYTRRDVANANIALRKSPKPDT
jgi:hypothetical protein